MTNADIKLTKLLNNNEIVELLNRIKSQLCVDGSSLEDLKEALKDNIKDHYFNCGLYHLDDEDIVQISDNNLYDLRGKTDNEIEKFKNTVIYAAFEVLSDKINADLNIDVWFSDNDLEDFSCDLVSNDETDEEECVAMIKAWAKEHQNVGIFKTGVMLNCCNDYKE